MRKRNIVLASASPRRSELMHMLGFSDVIVHPAQGEEQAPKGASPEETVKALSRSKAEEVAALFEPDALVIAADTIVWLDGEILGKPHSEEQAFAMLREAKRETGLPIVSEINNPNNVGLYDDIDILQVSSRSMQNYELLKELGTLKKPVLLKRGSANTLKELLMSAEYIMAGGNEQIILCERGIRSWDFSEGAARNTLDIACIPALHEMTHLPVIVDPSHATGIASMVEPMALAAAAGGADGLMIEVHNDPMNAVCDGAQSLDTEGFAALANKVSRVRAALM